MNTIYIFHKHVPDYEERMKVMADYFHQWLTFTDMCNLELAPR